MDGNEDSALIQPTLPALCGLAILAYQAFYGGSKGYPTPRLGRIFRGEPQSPRDRGVLSLEYYECGGSEVPRSADWLTSCVGHFGRVLGYIYRLGITKSNRFTLDQVSVTQLNGRYLDLFCPDYAFTYRKTLKITIVFGALSCVSLLWSQPKNNYFSPVVYFYYCLL